MDKLECDECGTLNDSELDACELCGDPLGEERERRQTRSAALLAVVATLATVPGFAVPGVVLEYVFWALYRLSTDDLGWTYSSGVRLLFWGSYAVAWLVGVVFSTSYDRDKQYRFTDMADYDDYLEDRDKLPFWAEYGESYTWGYDFEDRLDHERAANAAHTTLGCLLAPLSIVRGLWIQCYLKMTGAGGEG